MVGDLKYWTIKRTFLISGNIKSSEKYENNDKDKDENEMDKDKKEKKYEDHKKDVRG